MGGRGVVGKKKSQEAALKFMRPWRAILPVCESFSNKIPFCGHRNWLCRCGRAAAPAATTQPARTPSPPHHTPSHSCMQHSTPREGGCCGPVGLIKSRFTLILIHAKPFLPFVFSLIYAANTHRAGRERGDQGERLKSVLKLKLQLQLGRSIERFRRVVPRKFSLEW